jgi:hypothetical protein
MTEIRSIIRLSACIRFASFLAGLISLLLFA